MLKFATTALNAPKVEILKNITPANYNEAKQEWLEQAKKGHFTSPKFVYHADVYESKVILNDWNELCAKWENFTPHSEQEQLLYGLIDDYLNRQRMIGLITFAIAVGDDSLTNSLMRQYYGQTSPELIKLAYDLANGTTAIDFPLLDSLAQRLNPAQVNECFAREYEAHDIKKLFEATLEEYHLQNIWKVVIDDIHSSICVTTLTSEDDSCIYIPCTRKVNEIKAIQLVGHEIECHVRHNENCIALLQDIFDIPRVIAAKLVSDRNGTLTEGFAKISDATIKKRCLGTDDGAPEPWYIIMADLAKQGESFAQITERLHEEWGVGLSKCYTQASRIFRGCHDTANPRKFSRQADRSYLEGYIKAIALREEASPLYNFAKFDEKLWSEITSLIGELTTNYLDLGVSNKLINNL